MAVKRYDLGQNSASVIGALSQVPSKELVILLTQHATLPRLITNSLHILAISTIQNGLRGLQNEQQKYADQIGNILRRLISRGDPSQARRLVPTQASLIDLAVCTNSKDILARLVDEKGTEDILKAAVTAYNTTTSSTQDQEIIAPATKVLARLFYALPRWKHAPNNTARKGHASKAPYPSSKEVEKLFESFQKQFSSIKVTNAISAADESKLYAKISIMEATWALLERQVSINAIHAADLDKLLINATNGSGITPLIDLPLFFDIALVKPVIPLLRKVNTRSQALETLAQRVQKLSSEKGEGSNVSDLSPAWKQVLILSQKDLIEQEKFHSNLDSDLLSTVTAIMPQWEQYLDKLKDKLSKSPYLDQSNDLIIQMLLDEEEPQTGDQGAPSTSAIPTQEIDPMELLRQRANVFDDQPLESSRLIYGKGKGRNTKITLGSGLSDEEKARIIARAEAPDSDEEDREEWDPFAESDGMNRLEVGFEEELDEGGDDYTGSISIRRPVAEEEEGSEVEEDGIEEAEIDGRHSGAGHGTIHSNNAKANVESERAAERIMITAWKENGAGLFEKQQRGSSNRKQLIARLNQISTSNKRWDDQLIESWATMFNRNPRKEKLLANVDDLMRIGNTNRAPMNDAAEENTENQSKFGPDRGRGGRILGGGGQHSRGGGRGGGGGNRGSRGRGGNHRGNRGKSVRGGH